MVTAEVESFLRHELMKMLLMKIFFYVVVEGVVDYDRVTAEC